MSENANQNLPPSGAPNEGVPGLPPAPPADDPIAAMQRELAEMRTTLQRLPTKPATPASASSTPDINAQKKALEDQFWQDPIAMTHLMAQTAAVNARQEVLQAVGPTLTEAAKQQARASDPELFDHLLPQIMQKVATVSPDLQTNPITWTTAFSVVKGEKIDDVLQFKASRQVSKPGGPQHGAPKPPPTPAGPVLNDEEKRFARKFGLTDEQYLEGRAMYDDQSKYFGAKRS